MAQSDEIRYHENELVFKINDQTATTNPTINFLLKQSDLARLFYDYDISAFERLFKSDIPKLKGYYWLKHTSGSTDELLQKLQRIPWIELVEKLPVYHTSFTPSDLNSGQWSLKKVNAETAWDYVKGSKTVVVAVVDDAVFIDHDDLKDNVWTNSGEIPGNNIDDDGNGYIDDVNGCNAHKVTGDPRPNTTLRLAGKQTHGTHVAGIAAGRTNNLTGMASLSFNVSLMSIKASYVHSSGTAQLSTAALARGIEYAVMNKADVINMSWGGFAPSATIRTALSVAHDSGIVLVAAAGNYGTIAYGSWYLYPASYPNVIGVGATDQNDRKANFSQYNDSIDVMAPGVSIYSTLAKSTSSYGVESGTSMASPMVAALSALILSKNPELTPEEVEEIIETTATNINALNTSYLGKIGSGRINAADAIKATPAVVADFSAESVEACQNAQLKFSDLSRGKNYLYKWSFPGGTPSSSTAPNPVVSYSTNGKYDVQLIVSNAFGADTLLRKQYITISTPSAKLQTGVTHIFQGQNATLRVDFTGKPPFTFGYTNGVTTDTVANINTKVYYVVVKPDTTRSYRLTFMNDADCSGDTSGYFTVNVSESVLDKKSTCTRFDFQSKISDTQGNFGASFSGNDNLGRTSCEIGDLDGDGIPDLAVGAHRKEFSGITRGALYILFMDTNQNVKSYKEITTGKSGFTYSLGDHDHFGSSVTNLGDLDLDGVQDLAVGAVGVDDGGGDNGALFILYMKKDGTVKSYAKISATTGKVTGLSSGAHFGVSAKCIGDYDGDNIPDIAVGAYEQNNKRGAVYILALNKNGTVKSQNIIGHNSTNFTSLDYDDYFGVGIGLVGDIDGNGVNDILVGAHLDDDGYTSAGSFYMLFLKKDGTVRKTIKYSNLSPDIDGIIDGGSIFGRSIEPISYDGSFIRVMVTANGYKSNEGSVWQMDIDTFGNANNFKRLDSDHPAFSGKLSSADNMGFSVAHYTDEKANHYLAIGAVGDDDGGSEQGALYILSYTDSACNRFPGCSKYSYIRKISDTQGGFNATFSGGDRFGRSATDLGDLDGDGNSDIMVGAHGHSNVKLNEGAAYIMFLDSSKNIKSYKEIGQNLNGFGGSLDAVDGFGCGLAPIGDLDGDGVTEIAIGSHQDDDGISNAGAVYINFMRKNGTIKSTQKISLSVGKVTGLGNRSTFGSAVASMGDFNHDGINDIAVSAQRFESKGGVYILALNSNGTVKSQTVLSSGKNGIPTLATDDFFGTTVDNIGDIDQNGVDDLLVGSQFDDDGATNSGSIYLLMMKTDGTVRKWIKYSNNTLALHNRLMAAGQFGVSADEIYTANGMSRIVVGANGPHPGYGRIFQMDIDTFGNAYNVIEINSDHPELKGKLYSKGQFGYSVAVVEDGHNGRFLAVGASHDNDGGTDNGAVYLLKHEDTCHVDTTPCTVTADFLVSKSCLNEGTSFINTSKPGQNVAINNIRWNFGDGYASAGGDNLTHYFSKGGSYKVQLIVSARHMISYLACKDTLTQTITVRDTILYSMADRDTVCAGDSLELGISNLECATTPLKYTWWPNAYINDINAANPKVSPHSSMWYYLYLESNTGVQVTDSIYIHVTPICCKSYARFEVDKTSMCAGDSITMTNTSDVDDATVSYTWVFGSKSHISSYSGKTPPIVRMVSPGWDTITLITADKCGFDTSITVVWISPLPALNDFKDTAVCEGDTVRFDLSTNDFFNFYTWSPSGKLIDTLSDFPAYVATQNEQFVFTLTDGNTGCQIADTLSVRAIPYPVVYLGEDTTLCNGDSLWLTSTTNGAQYKWDDNSSDSVRKVASPGQYWLEVDYEGCVERDTIQVYFKPNPYVNLGNDTVICDGDSILLDATGPKGTTYLWSDLSQKNTLTVYTSDTYWVEVELNGCKASDTITVGQDSHPVIDLGNDTVICGGQSILLDATFPSASYRWDNLSTSPTRLVNSTGLYWVDVTLGNCLFSDSVSVQVIPVPPGQLDDVIRLCDSVDITIGPEPEAGYRYRWNTGDTTSRLYIDITGQYILTTSHDQCSSLDTTVVLLDITPTFSMPDDTVVCTGDKLTMDMSWINADRYNWQNNAPSPILNTNVPGTYVLTASNGNCSHTDSINLSFEVCQCKVYFPNAFTPAGDGLNDSYRPIPYCKVESLHFIVYNRWGVVVFETDNPNDAWDGTYAGEPAMQGVYAVEYYYTYNDNGTRRRAKTHAKVLLIQKFD